jgi:hypothetical protein
MEVDLFRHLHVIVESVALLPAPRPLANPSPLSYIYLHDFLTTRTRTYKNNINVATDIVFFLCYLDKLFFFAFSIVQT